MQVIKVSESTAARTRIPIYMVSDTDGKTPTTAISWTTSTDFKVSKNGAAEGAPTSGISVTEVAGGLYYVVLNVADLDTVGFLTLRAIKSGSRTFVATVQIVSYDPFSATNLGLSALPTASPNASGGLPTFGTGTGQLNVTGGRADADVLRWNATAVATPDTAGYPKVTIKAGTGTGEISLSSGLVDITSTAADKVIRAVASSAQAGSTTTVINDTNRGEATGFWAGNYLVFTSGTNAGQVRRISTNTANTSITLAEQLAVSPTAGDTYIILRSSTSHSQVREIISGVITATSIASGAITTAKFASGAIDSTVLATDAIGSAQLATTAVNELCQVSSGTATTVTSTTVFTDSAQSTTVVDYWKDMLIRFTGGANAGVIRRISAYSAGKQFTVAAAFPSTINTNDPYIILGTGIVGSGATPAEVNTEVTNVVVAKKLDIIAGASATVPVVGSLIDKLMNKASATAQSYDPTTDSLEAQKDALANTSQIATAVWDQQESSIATTGSIGIKLKSAFPLRLTKNTAFSNFQFMMYDSNDHLSPKTGLTFSSATSRRVIDAGTLAATTNLPVEIAQGLYRLNMSAADLNGDIISFVFNPTGADQRVIHILTKTG